MKRTGLPLLLLVSTCAVAQVHVEKPVTLTATDSAQRGIEGLARAVAEGGLITLGDAQSGVYHWGQATGTGMAIELGLDPHGGHELQNGGK